MNKKGQIELGDVHPLAVVFGALGALIGFYTVKVMGGGGLAVGEASYHIGIIWRILIPIACGGVAFLMTNKMFEG